MWCLANRCAWVSDRPQLSALLLLEWRGQNFTMNTEAFISPFSQGRRCHSFNQHLENAATLFHYVERLQWICNIPPPNPREVDRFWFLTWPSSHTGFQANLFLLLSCLSFYFAHSSVIFVSVKRLDYGGFTERFQALPENSWKFWRLLWPSQFFCVTCV